jgi:chemotaxis methyl-accepting protein methylase
VAEYLESEELESPAALLARLRSSDQDPSALPTFLDGVLNVNTGFFRHPGAMNALARQVIPQLYARKSNDGPGTLRIWSAGCGTGEEAYSIAMALCEVLPNGNGASNGSSGYSSNGNGGKDAKEKTSRNGGVADNGATASAGQGNGQGIGQGIKDWSIHIVGSDLLPSAIEVAERGLYPQSALTGLPPTAIRACFSKIGGPNGSNGSAEASQNGNMNGSSNGSGNGSTSGSNNGPSRVSSNASSNASSNGAHLLVKPRLRSLVTFTTMNLTKPVYIGRFDCIFCMDVLPHLSRIQRTALMERLHLYLEPGGYLFLSQTEKLQAPNLNFRSENFDGYTFHRKPLAASAAYGR